MRLGAEPSSVLIVPVCNQRLGVCEAILLQFPQVVSLPSIDGNCKSYHPIHHASWIGDAGLVDLLLKYNADCHAITGDGNTALGLACHTSSLECAQRFISLGCDPNVQDKDNDTALIYATFNGQSEIARLLLECGANPHARSTASVTALWNAVFSQSLAIVEQLLRLNVDWAVCSKGREIHSGGAIYDVEVSPVFIALHMQQISVLKALFASGCYLHKEISTTKPQIGVDYLRAWDGDNKKWLEHITQNPPPLMWWCKKTIRSLTKTDFQNSVRSLNISSCMKSYIVESS